MDVCVRVVRVCVCVCVCACRSGAALNNCWLPCRRACAIHRFSFVLKLAGTTGSLFSYLTLRIHPYPHLHSDGR